MRMELSMGWEICDCISASVYCHETCLVNGFKVSIGVRVGSTTAYYEDILIRRFY